MPPPVLAPPPPASLPPRDAPPTLPVRAPLARAPRREPTGRVTRSSLAGSIALHLLLGAALLVVVRHEGRSPLPGESPARGAAAPGAAAGGGDAVSYLELRDFPSSAGAPLAPASAAATGAVAALPQDSVFTDLPALPHDVPRGIPAPSSRPAQGAGAGAPAGASAQPRADGGRPGSAPGTAGAASGPAGGAGAGSGSVFRPGYVDPRLVVKPGALPPPPPKSDIERYREHLADRIDAINAGEADEAEHQRRLHNWTWKDSRGREWGLGAGGVPIIAGHRLPTAIAPPIPRDRDREDAERERARRTAEIDAQDDATKREQYQRRRAAATRARQDSIRNARKNDPKTP